MKGSQPQVVTTRPDPKSQSYIDALRGRAREYADSNQFAGPNQALTDALAGFGGYAGAGQRAVDAFSGGDPSAFLNPYFKTLNPLFEQLNARAGTNADQAATRAGAFGGSRADVARAVGQGQVANTQAQLGYQNFNDARNYAGQIANLGFGALGQQGELGKYLQFLPQLFQSGQLGLLNQGLGPTGTTQETQTSSSPFQQLLGAGLSIAPFFLPGGPLAKGAISAATAGLGSRFAAQPQWPTFGQSGLGL